jgi:hypothetical protein
MKPLKNFLIHFLRGLAKGAQEAIRGKPSMLSGK